ncbi:hypothetical protein WMY93_016215 [Mugilogobius chulae]|uniref:DDE Tnp4 domain-containing protein n=1 Tax=Mugilogobius chulae TaxID=88201 RepID=A0AAW0NYR9_9GOBI
MDAKNVFTEPRIESGLFGDVPSHCCSMLFLFKLLLDGYEPEEITVTEKGKHILKTNVVPTLFEWNNYKVKSWAGVWERRPSPVCADGGDEGEVMEEEEPEASEVLSALQRFSTSPEDIRHYTRFASYEHLMSFWNLIESATQKMVRVTAKPSSTGTETPITRPTKLKPIDELFLFLMYLSTGYSEIELAAFRAALPTDFHGYENTQVNLDCTELLCQTPSSLLLQSEVFSKYKSHYTFKAMVGISPHGALTFVSSLFEYSMSDRELFRQSGVTSLLSPDMAIMVDKGFLVDDLVQGDVHRPAFLSKREQMPADDVLQTQSIARLRVHVERAIHRVKENKLFDDIIPLYCRKRQIISMGL